MDLDHDEHDKSPAKLGLPAQTNLFEKIRALVKGGQKVRAAVRSAIEGTDLAEEATRSWYKRWEKNDGRRHGNLLFSAEEEEELVGMLEAWSLLGRPLTRQVLLQEVKKLPGPGHVGSSRLVRGIFEAPQIAFDAQSTEGVGVRSCG